MVIALAVGAVVAALIAVWFVAQFNRLSARANAVDAAWGDIDTQLTLRHDLVPNLVATTRAHAAHEQATLNAAVQARQVALAAAGPTAAATADGALEGALQQVFALSEAYPDLKANQSFVELQRRLTGAEDAIAGMRQRYNSAVQDLNTAREIFPTTLVARSSRRFAAREYFSAGSV